MYTKTDNYTFNLDDVRVPAKYPGKRSYRGENKGTRHKQYRYLSDCDEKNLFSIEKFLSTQLKPKPSEQYDLYEVDASEMPTTA